jgi:hypothetical protein
VSISIKETIAGVMDIKGGKLLGRRAYLPPNMAFVFFIT